MWKPFPRRCVLKTLRGKPERESLKRIIFTSGGFGLLQSESWVLTLQFIFSNILAMNLTSSVINDSWFHLMAIFSHSIF